MPPIHSGGQLISFGGTVGFLIPNSSFLILKNVIPPLFA